MAQVKLSAKSVGSIVKLRFNGTMRNFIVVQQGKPSSLYDDSCNGTWVLMQQTYKAMTYDEASGYLGYQFINEFDADIREHIKSVKIPYWSGNGYTVNSGANGLSVRAFLLSAPEIGFTTSSAGNYTIINDGTTLDYFKTANAGANAAYMLRSPHNVINFDYVLCVNGAGSLGHVKASSSYYIRPAMILDPDLLVSDDGAVTTNTAPTTPGSITIPESIQGGTSIQISWSAAADAESNLEGYVVDRSTDGGGTWVQIYQGSATQTTNTVPAGSDTVMYRVKAYDSEGLYSTYRNSAQVSVFNNAAPNAPAGITVPENVLGGGTLTVTWGAASDPDNNLTGYELERQVDGGEWAQVYKGADTGYTDSITRGWASVNYRVRSYDAYNAASGYTTGTARTVNNNRAPAITCDAASGSGLGTKNADFSISYSVGDADNDAVTVTEAIDGVELRTFSAAADGSSTFAVTGDTFFKLLNGAHILTISASDGQAASVHKLTFTKSVTAATVTLAQPMEADDKITICVLSVHGDIPADAQFNVKVTNNAKDAAPVWEDCTMEVRNGGNHIFTNGAAANGFAFNFKVSVERGPSGQGGFINSVQGGFQ